MSQELKKLVGLGIVAYEKYCMQIQFKKKERERKPMNGSIKSLCYIAEFETKGAQCQHSPVILFAWHPVPCPQESRGAKSLRAPSCEEFHNSL